ncbi:MAG: ATP-binding cassette domain-containing protein, partial [Clostridioides difficile]|nr:ATP-binding cassette domain-containing protein [Clostridioides difficile]
MTPIIQFKNIKKQYNDKTIIDNLNLDIEKGAFLTVIGSSGSGKTTLLKMINGLILPDGGNILINQTDIKNEDLIKLRRRIGYC